MPLVFIRQRRQRQMRPPAHYTTVVTMTVIVSVISTRRSLLYALIHADPIRIIDPTIPYAWQTVTDDRVFL